MTSIGVFITFCFVGILSADAQNLDFITDHLSTRIHWQEGNYQQILSKEEAIIRLDQLSHILNKYEVHKIHDARWDAPDNTYEVVHIKNNFKEYRLFFLYQKNHGKFEIIKLRLTEI